MTTIDQIKAYANRVDDDHICDDDRVWRVSLRSAAIREFCDAMGLSASTEAENLPDDVKTYRMEQAVSARRVEKSEQR